MLADLPAHRAVLFPDRGRLGLEALPYRPALSGRIPGDAEHAVQGPTQVHGRGTGGGEQRGVRVDLREERPAREGAIVAQPRHQPHRGGDADQRRPAHLQVLDRVGHGRNAFQVPRSVILGQRQLVHDAHGAGRRPGDGLDGHGVNLTRNGERGTRNIHTGIGPPVPRSEFRVPR